MTNAGKLIAEMEGEFNAKTNALVERHAKQIETLREELERLKAESLESIAALLDVGQT
jgi:hypothetical protein